MQKRAQMLYRNPCSICDDARKFLEDHGVIVKVRDLTREPLKQRELNSLLGNHDPKHYLDMMSPSFEKQNLDSQIPPRHELFAVIEEHPELLRHPIVMYGRLMTIGFNRQQMIEMFQLTVSGNGSGGGETEDQSNGKSKS
jgi:regulatory protein spx